MTTTTNLKITEITSSQASKEVTANAAFERIDGALGSTYALSMTSDANLDFSTGTPPGETEALSSLRINITSTVTLTTRRTITFPTNNKLYIIRNGTTGGQQLRITCSGATSPYDLAPNDEGFFLMTSGGPLRIGGYVHSQSQEGEPWFGDGADGDVTITGGTTTLTRDMFYNNLTITSTGVLVTAGCKIYVKYRLDCQTSGVIHCDGNAGLADGTAGAALTNVNVGGTGTPGGAGGTAGGTAGGSSTNSCFGNPGGSAANGGGAGGNGTGGSGGAAGQYTPISAASGNSKYFAALISGLSHSSAPSVMRTGGGGGGGGGDGTAGGGGGGAAGWVVLHAYIIMGGGTIRAKGGNGGTPAAGNRGGGGGGQGGRVVLVCKAITTVTVSAAGGTKGTKSGTGTDGANGSDGETFTIVVP